MTGRVRVGCSGWVYRDWRGTVYPADLPQRRWFESYATRFDTVELNATFYRLPTTTAVEHWAEQAPRGFVYAAKLGQFGSHRMTAVFDADVAGPLPLPAFRLQLDLLDARLAKNIHETSLVDQSLRELDVEFFVAVLLDDAHVAAAKRMAGLVMTVPDLATIPTDQLLPSAKMLLRRATPEADLRSFKGRWNRGGSLLGRRPGPDPVRPIALRRILLVERRAGSYLAVAEAVGGAGDSQAGEGSRRGLGARGRATSALAAAAHGLRLALPGAFPSTTPPRLFDQPSYPLKTPRSRARRSRTSASPRSRPQRSRRWSTATRGQAVVSGETWACGAA